MTKYPGTMFVLALCILLEVTCDFFPEFRNFLALHPGGWAAPLQIITYQFAHAGWEHLIGNFCYGLPFMAFLESKIGKKKFLEFYVLCGISSAVFMALLAGPVGIIGASGSIFGCMVGACLAFGNDFRLDHAMALVLLLARLIPQLAMAPAGNIYGIAFYGHVGGAIGGLVLAHRFYASHAVSPEVK